MGGDTSVGACDVWSDEWCERGQSGAVGARMQEYGALRPRVWNERAARAQGGW